MTAGATDTALPPMAPPGRLRFPELDVLRGAAIILVVYLHAYFSAWEVTPRREVVTMHVIHFFAHGAVPVFLFVSGFLLAREPDVPFREFARRKAMALGLPLFACMTAALVYRAWDAGGLSRGLVRSYLEFDISGQYYYLFVLGIFMAAFFPVRSWSGRRLAWLTAAAFAVNLATVAYYQASDIGGTFATVAYRNPFSWVFFFASGFVLARSRGSLALPGRVLLPALLAMAALFAIYMVQGEVYGDYPVSYFGFTVFLFSALAAPVYASLAHALCRHPAGRAAAWPLTWLSRYSFSIYLVHMPFFLGYVTDRYVSGSSLADDYFKLMNSLFVVGFLSSLAFVVAADRFAPRPVARLIGLERPHR